MGVTTQNQEVGLCQRHMIAKSRPYAPIQRTKLGGQDAAAISRQMLRNIGTLDPLRSVRVTGHVHHLDQGCPSEERHRVADSSGSACAAVPGYDDLVKG